MNPIKDGVLLGRKLEFFHHESGMEIGYKEQQTDTFALIHPNNQNENLKYPLYVVFHSAGHDVYSAVSCTQYVGNHDIYHTPSGMFGLYLDCRTNMGKKDSTDWWWGGIDAHGNGGEERKGTSLQPVEKRCLETIRWVIENYPIDTESVYAVGNSMGGSGALGIALTNGDLFAAVKVNVPAGVYHVADRCMLQTDDCGYFQIPDPPIVVDYSAQNDSWSNGHEILYDGMKNKKYALFGYFGEFGHENCTAKIEEKNDLVHSFDIFSVRLHEAYPVFTNSTTDDEIPWGKAEYSGKAGQLNAFFRWNVIKDSSNEFSIELRLLHETEWQSRIDFPEASTADVTIRRLQNFKVRSDDKILWTFGNENGEITVDSNGLITIPSLTVTKAPKTLTLQKQ